MDRPIYLDYNATTPVDPAVVEAMLPYLQDQFGNASSAHAYGYTAKSALQHARGQLAALLGATTDEVVFAGGGSEADNLAICGVVFARLSERPHIVATTVEHPAVLNTLQYLHLRFDVDYTLVSVDEQGCVSAADVEAALRPSTVLVSIMHANNEVGTLQPIPELAEVVHRSGALFHVDAAQSVGKVPVNVRELGVDLLTVAAHKLYGPKGIGALYVRRGTQLDPVIHGSSQEHGLRAGTENIAGIVGLGKASELAHEALGGEEQRLREVRDLLHARLSEKIPGTVLNGHPVARLPNTLNVSLPGAIGQTVLALCPDVAASTGSACHSGSPEPSAVLLAMGLAAERALGAVRLSLGRWSTPVEMEQAAEAIAVAYGQAAVRTAAG